MELAFQNCVKVKLLKLFFVYLKHKTKYLVKNSRYYLQKHYPKLCEVIDIGKTIEKRPMLVLKIGSTKFEDKPAIVIEGGKHSTTIFFQKDNFFKVSIVISTLS